MKNGFYCGINLHQWHVNYNGNFVVIASEMIKNVKTIKNCEMRKKKM